MTESTASWRSRSWDQIDYTLHERAPKFMADAYLWASSQGVQRIPTVDFGDPPEPYIRVSEKVACAGCQVIAERAAARGPSWCVVEIKRGPGDVKPSVRVAKTLRKR